VTDYYGKGSSGKGFKEFLIAECGMLNLELKIRNPQSEFLRTLESSNPSHMGGRKGKER
jgi:hypothetical protein